MTSPPRWHPKQNQPRPGRTWNDGLFSSWKGQSPLNAPPPADLSVTCCLTISTMSARSRTSAMSSSRIRPATRAVYVRATTVLRRSSWGCGPSRQGPVPGHDRGVGEAGDLVDGDARPGGVVTRGCPVVLERALQRPGRPVEQRGQHLPDDLPLPVEEAHPVLGPHDEVCGDPLEDDDLERGRFRDDQVGAVARVRPRAEGLLG